MITVEKFIEKHGEQLHLNHEWVKKYRVPVISSHNCGVYIIAGLVVPDPNETYFFPYETPDEEDAALMGEYIQQRITTFYNPMYARQMGEYPVDVDPGVNTSIFMKVADRGWLYYRLSWEHGPVPFYGSDKKYETLLEVLEAERGQYCGQEWVDWFTEQKSRSIS